MEPNDAQTKRTLDRVDTNLTDIRAQITRMNGDVNSVSRTMLMLHDGVVQRLERISMRLESRLLKDEDSKSR